MSFSLQDWIKRADSFQDVLGKSHEIFGLLARLYIAKVFLLSGYSKISDWSTTLYLFSDEYSVPLLPPVIAAVLGTFGELFFSVTLLIGYRVRLSALGLFAVNLIAVVSYYSTLSASPPAIHDHIEWGLILGLLLSAHPRCLALDAWLARKKGESA
jgi:putative oxidoreductase